MVSPVRRVRPIVALAAAAGLVLTACGQAPSGVAATVNGIEIRDAELQRLVGQERANMEAAGEVGPEQLRNLREVQRQVLSSFVKLRLLKDAAAARGIEVTDQDVEDLWQEQVAIFGTVEELQARLDEIGLTEELAREQLAVGQLTERLQDEIRATIEVTEQDIRDLYDSLEGQWTTRGVSHIQLGDEAAAAEVKALLDEDPDRFADLANERSLDVNTGPLGGIIGDQPRGVGYPDNFEAAIWDSPVGSIIGPLETQFGWHVIRVDSETIRTLEDVREQLGQQLRGQQFPEVYGAFEQELYGGAEIVVDARYGSWDPEVGEVVLRDPLDQ